jgi:hypothetical protein
MAFAAGYALLAAALLADRLHDWQVQGLEGIYSPSTAGWGVLLAWAGAGVALILCAALAGRAPRSVGVACVVVAGLGFVAMLALGPIRVTSSTGGTDLPGTIGDVSPRTMVAAWSFLALFAVVAGVVCLRAPGGARLTSASSRTARKVG